VQANKEGAIWCEPDEIFLEKSKKLINITDKRIFWEMSKAIMELPELSAKCKSGIAINNIIVSANNYVLNRN
jgi:hypothetical protein